MREGGEAGRGEGGEGGEGGRGGKGRGGRGGGCFWCSSPTDSPKSIGRRRNFTAGPWGSFMGSHRGDPPPPPHNGNFAGWGVSEEGIKRWGIEGIRIGTSDRFGRGRGELDPR